MVFYLRNAIKFEEIRIPTFESEFRILEVNEAWCDNDRKWILM